MAKTTLLYRPVGLIEAKLIHEAGARRFPPRLPEQPIFYPVMNEAYAEEIAVKWNTKSPPGFAGFVTRFAVDTAYQAQFEEQVVGAKAVHRELWVPAEQLDEFNRHIVGIIHFSKAFYGDAYQGLPATAQLAERTAAEQLPVLNTLIEDATEFTSALNANQVVVQLNYAYWQQRDFTTDGIDALRKEFILNRIRQYFRERPEPVALVGLKEP